MSFYVKSVGQVCLFSRIYVSVIFFLKSIVAVGFGLTLRVVVIFVVFNI